MDDQHGMTLARARDRGRDRTIPEFWLGSTAGLERALAAVKLGRVETIAHSPGGRPLDLVAYGPTDLRPRRANYNSAIGARTPEAFVDRRGRSTPVLLLIGPVHGQETEGLTGLGNLIAIMETGRDLAGRDQTDLRVSAGRCRLLIVPAANPDGLARFEPQSLVGLTVDDLRFWGQGTRLDHTYWGWPGCKSAHPMRGDVAFLGAYFNDLGINPMHDDFFDPMSTEAPALLRLAKREAPDIVVSLHAHGGAPALLRPAYVPDAEQERVRRLAEHLAAALQADGLPAGKAPGVAAESGNPPAAFNLVSALHHIGGAAAVTFECPHGLVGDRMCAVGHRQILDIQLCLYRTLMQALLDDRG